MNMPEPGTQEFENMIDFMRADLDSGMQYTKIEIAARKLLKDQGRDFEAEFKKWKEKRND
jgi:hypothetical protein